MECGGFSIINAYEPMHALYHKRITSDHKLFVYPYLISFLFTFYKTISRFSNFLSNHSLSKVSKVCVNFFFFFSEIFGQFCRTLSQSLSRELKECNFVTFSQSSLSDERLVYHSLEFNLYRM